MPMALSTVSVVRSEPRIQVSRPSGYTTYSIVEAKQLVTDLQAAINEAEAPQPALRVGARVRRTWSANEQGVVLRTDQYVNGRQGGIEVAMDHSRHSANWASGSFEVIA